MKLGRRSAWGTLGLTMAFAAPALAADTEKYDPDGIRGISRFAETYAKATAAQRDRKTDEAIALVQQAMALQPKNPAGPLALAELQFLAGRRAEALQALTMADPLTGSRDLRMRTRVLVLRALVTEKLGGGDALAAWLEADAWVTEANAAGPERANIRAHVEALSKMRGQAAQEDAIKARIAEGEAKAATP